MRDKPSAVERRDLVIVHEDAARIGAHQPDDVPQGDTLARSAAAEQTERRRAWNLERHLVEDAPVTKGLGDRVEANDGVRHQGSRRLGKQQEDQPHQYDIDHNQHDRRHDDAARRGAAHTFGSLGRGHPEKGRDDRR